MKHIKKIASLWIVLWIVIVLVGCTYVEKTDPYISTDAYEQKLIDAVYQNQESVVGIIHNQTQVGSGVIFKRENNGLSYSYYVVTSYMNISSVMNSLQILVVKNNTLFNVTNYAYHSENNIAILKFSSSIGFDVAKISKDEAVLGQTVVSMSLPSNDYMKNSARMGVVSRVKSQTFMFDSSMNIGDLGGAIYSLKGEVIGIFSAYRQTFNEEEYADGINQAFNISFIQETLANWKDDNFNKGEVALATQLVTKYEAVDPYEKQQITTAQTIEDVTVSIYLSNELVQSGVLIKKEIKTAKFGYYVITAYEEMLEAYESSVTIKTSSGHYITPTDGIYLEDKGVILMYFETIQNMGVSSYDDTKVTQGQSVLVNGMQSENEVEPYITAGILSKETIEVNPLLNSGFMIDASVNPYQIGGGVFNYQGSLLGIVLDKHYTVETSLANGGTETLLSEGVVTAMRFESIAKVLDLSMNQIEETEDLSRDTVSYQAKTVHEKSEIEMIETVTQSVVTVELTAGHGSGTIFKKETLENGKYLYYVVTNAHVANEAEEINIKIYTGFTYVAKDYYAITLQDIAIVRFETEDLLRVQEVEAISNNSGTESAQGQLVYAIGSPIDNRYYNYVTRGILVNLRYPYNLIFNLTMMIDAPINPGNSGGALFNIAGKLIGVNVAKITQTQTKFSVDAARGLGLSLNINVIAPTIVSVRESQYIALERRARLGISVVEMQAFIDAYGEQMAPPNAKGVMILSIDPTRGAYQKLKVFDNLIEINGKPVLALDSVSAVISNAQFGDEFQVKVLRKVGDVWKEYQYTITII